MTTLRRGRTLAALALAPALVAGAAFAQAQPPTYVATYSAASSGSDVGTSVFSVRSSPDSDRMTYASETEIKGFRRMFLPNPIVDRSEFVVVDNAIRPLAFSHEDGSRKGEDNHSIAFDWQTGTAGISGANGKIDVAIAPGTLDRSSLQVALMLDLGRGIEPESYAVVDEDSLKTYHYEPMGAGTVETGIGPIDVVSYTQTREGSSRTTTIHFAPSLGYIPVRIEQTRDGESQSLFVLQSLER